MQVGDRMIKLIVMDMDGTLLNEDNIILPETKHALMKAQQQGIRLVLASGRSYSKLMPYAKELEMERYGGYLIEVNGMAMYDLEKGKRYVQARMESVHVQELFSYFRQWDVEIIANIDDGMYDYNPPRILKEKKVYREKHNLPDDYPWTGGAFHFLSDNRIGYPRLTYIQTADEIIEPINKISVTYHAEIMDEVTKQAKLDLSDHYWVGRTTERWLEIMLPDITKGNGLKKLAEKLCLSHNEIMAFGDGENDIEMLEAVKYSIAMENALPNVKNVVYDVTASNNHNGIAKAIHKYLHI